MAHRPVDQAPATHRVRQAFSMRLRPGNEAEYRRRHDEIWPELAELIRAYGIRNYSIYRHGLDLFGYLEVDDTERLGSLPEEPVLRRWWGSMAELMDTNPDLSPVQVALEEVFHQD